jgi:surfactin synthase thioesterase subunit
VTCDWLAPSDAWARHAMRLFCFPFAGGTALSYAPFSFHLPAELGICALRLPGRDGHPPAPSCTLAALADQVTEGLLPFLDRPFALFGHSLGAHLAFEVALRLEGRGTPPGILYASACRPPGDDEPVISPDEMTDPELVEALVAASAIESDIAASPLIQQEVLPRFRWDLGYAASYRQPTGVLASCPVVALGGLDDAFVATRALLAWRGLTRGASRVRRFPGDHFYAFRGTAALLDHLRPELERLGATADRSAWTRRA